MSWQCVVSSFAVRIGGWFGSLWAVQGNVIGFTGTKHARSSVGRVIGRLSSQVGLDRIGTGMGDTDVVSVGSGGQGGRSVPRLCGFGRCPLFAVGRNVDHNSVALGAAVAGTSRSSCFVFQSHNVLLNVGAPVADGVGALPWEVPDDVPPVVGARSVLPFQGSCSSNSGSGRVVSVTTPLKFGASVMGKEVPRTK